MPTSDKAWQENAYRDGTPPSIALFRKGRVDPTEVQAAVFPEATPSVLAREAAEAEETDHETAKIRADQMGYQRGLQEAQRRFDARLDELRAQVKGSVEAFRRGLDQAEQRSDREAIELAVELAEHVLRQKLSVDFDAIATSLAGGVEGLEGLDPITVTARAEEAKLLEQNIGALQEAMGVAGVRIEVDESFAPGDYLLQRGDSTMDMRLKRRLHHLKTAILETTGMQHQEI